MKGRLQDISGSGFKAYFKGNRLKEFKDVTNYDESTLHVADESMDCGLDARHAVYNEEKRHDLLRLFFSVVVWHETTVCGSTRAKTSI